MTRRPPRPTLRIPADLLPGRRPLRLRAVQGAAGAARRRRSRPAEPSSARRTARRRSSRLVGAVRAGLRRPVRPARRLGDRARQRRHDRVLGRRLVRARRAAQRAPRVRRVLVEVRRGLRGRAAPRRPGRRAKRPRRPPRRRRRATASTSTPSPTTRPPPAWRWSCAGRAGIGRRRAGRRRRHVRRRRPGVGPGRGRRLLLRPAEVLRHRRRAVDRRLLARRPSSASSASPPVDRWRPASLDLGIALTNSRLDQTYNTPAVATLLLLDGQLRWMLGSGGLDWCVKRSRRRPPTTSTAGPRSGRGRRRSSPIRPSARPWSARSTSTRTIDADKICAALRANGIVDTDSYRKLGRNQLRIGMFPAIDPADVEALTACIDHLVEHHASRSHRACGPRPDRRGPDARHRRAAAAAPARSCVVGLTGWFDVAGAATSRARPSSDEAPSSSARSTPTRSTTSPRSARWSSSSTARPAG